MDNKNILLTDIKFCDLCNLFSKVRNANQHSEKTNLLQEFISQHRCSTISFYPLLRLMLPKLDRERGPYGLQEKAFAKVFIKILFLPKNSSDYNNLLNYTTVLGQKAKDFADVAVLVLKKHFCIANNFSVLEVNSCLDNIANHHGQKDIRAQEEELSKLFRGSNNEEQMWLIRIILKDLRLGVSEEKILKLFHPDAVELYNNNSNLQKVTEILYSPNIHLHEIEIDLFSPFRPMLAEKCDIKVINKVVNGKEKFFIENKFDGERFQLHMKNATFSYFSRRGFDYTKTFGKNCSGGLFTPMLKSVIKENVSSFILDGEMMGWNRNTNEFGSKGMHFDVKNLTTSTLHQPCFVVFDILLLNDEVLTNKPLKQRLQMLQSALNPKVGTLIISEVKEFVEKQSLLNYLNKTIDQNDEGVVFKNPNSLYVPNDRKSGWWKLKLEYFENVMSDLDVIIMGGYYGEGRRSKQVSGFLVGLADRHAEKTHPDSYLSFAKIQSGLSDAELEILNKKIGPFWKTSGSPESHGLKLGKEKPNLWIAPKNSCILVARGSELTKVTNNDYQAPYTLRFPRIQRINVEKPYYDCATLNELQELTNTSKSIVKLNGRHLTLADLQVETRVKKRRNVVKPVDFSDVSKVTNVLEGFEFCVWSGTDDVPKKTIETRIVENGGLIAQVEREETFCVLMGNHHTRLKTYRGPKDVVKLEWIHRILDVGEFDLYRKNEIIYVSNESKLRLMAENDKYGDSYMEAATEESLQNIIKEMQLKNDCFIPSSLEIADLKQEMQFSEDIQFE